MSHDEYWIILVSLTINVHKMSLRKTPSKQHCTVWLLVINSKFMTFYYRMKSKKNDLFGEQCSPSITFISSIDHHWDVDDDASFPAMQAERLHFLLLIFQI